MNDNWILEVIDENMRKDTQCTACSASVVPAEHDGALWLECMTLTKPLSGLRRLTAWVHTRQLLISARDMATAA